MTQTISPCELGIADALPMPQRGDWRIGIVGFGGISRAHVDAYQAAGWPIVAVADPSPDARQRAADALPAARVYEDYADLIADENVEVVSLLTQPNVRVPIVEAAMAHGKPVLTEKPFAETIEDCEAMVALSEQYGVPLAVSQCYRWSGAHFYARAIIERGLIGEPYYAAIEIQGSQDVALAKHHYYATCDGFLTIQWNNHLADLLRYWFGADAVRVQAFTRRMTGQNFASDNLLLATADFGEGKTGHIVHSELLRSELCSRGCRIDGDAGSVTFDVHGTELTIHCEQTGAEPCVVDPGDKPLAGCFAGPMADLLIAIENDTEPSTSGRRNLATMRHVLAEDRSAAADGAWVAL